MSHRVIFLFYICELLALVACGGTLEIGVERTPTPNLAVPATLAALQAQNDALATRVAALTTPTPAVLDLGMLAYVQGGDIWLKALPDGKAQRLTTDGRNSEPRWSPSGEWLAFRKERQVFIPREVPCDIPNPRNELCRESVATMQKQIWVVEANGVRARLLNQGLTVDAFAWSPRGNLLAFVTESIGLRVYDPETTNLVALVTHTPGEANPGRIGKIAWSPDSARIAYEWQHFNATTTGLWLVALNPVQRTQVYVSDVARRGDAILGGWMPDNRSIFFWQSDTRAASFNEGVPLYALRVDTSASSLTRLTDAMLAYADFVAPAPARTNPGSRNLLALVTGNGQAAWSNKRVETTKPLTASSSAAIAPQWSPNGAQIAFAAMPQRRDLGIGEDAMQELMQRRIWLADALGEREPQRVTNNANYRDERPLWSADGHHLLFARFDRQGRASLWLVTLTTNFTRQIVDELTPAPDPFGFYGHVEWDGLFDWWRGVEK